MKTEKGWVAIYRKIDEGRYWLKEKFTKGQAWIDLIMLANHQRCETYVRGINLKMERGQLFWSQEALSKRWKWSKDKVQNYLKDLENHGEISYKVVHKIGVITVLNYNNYQDFSLKTSLQTSLQTVYKTALNNNVNNVNNGIYIEIINHFNEIMGTKFRSLENKNVDYWLGKGFSLGDFKKAITNLPSLEKENKGGGFWKEMTPIRFFRIRNANGEPDTIEQALNYQPKREIDWSSTNNKI